MNTEQMKAVLAAIKANDRIILFRHYRPDGDAVGSTKGLRAILRASFPEKDIRLINSDFADFTAFLGGEDDDMPDDFYAGALGIVLDTGTEERISNKRYTLCKQIARIDHHINIKPYGNPAWVEEERSSTCEMIVAFYEAFKDELTLPPEAATYLYAGMVTDSGRFRFRSVSGDTLRLAALLLDAGVDTESLYAHLYMKEFNTFKFQSYVYKKMKISRNGVVYLYITRGMQKKFGLTSEQASATVSHLESIKNCLVWIVFIEGQDKKTRVRLRSRFVTISEVAEKYNGGGHACAAGATVYSKKEAIALVADADKRLAEYKATHEGWL